jgi:hypothetical protein
MTTLHFHVEPGSDCFATHREAIRVARALNASARDRLLLVESGRAPGSLFMAESLRQAGLIEDADDSFKLTEAGHYVCIAVKELREQDEHEPTAREVVWEGGEAIECACCPTMATAASGGVRLHDDTVICKACLPAFRRGELSQ